MEVKIKNNLSLNTSSLTEEEKRRLVNFFEVLIKIDRKKQITETAKKIYGSKE